MGIVDFHGEAAILADTLRRHGRFPVDLTVTSASVLNGVLTAEFLVMDRAGEPVSNVVNVFATAARLAPATAEAAGNRWVPYVYRAQVVTQSAAGDWPNPDGTQANQGTWDTAGVLINLGAGRYTYTYATQLLNVVRPVDNTAVPFVANVRTRVSVAVGGDTGPHGEGWLDFVPSGAPLTSTPRNELVATTSCIQCHGNLFSTHQGRAVHVETCVTCHAPGTSDPHGGETLDFPVMLHKVHAGGALQSIPGPDGWVWDNPATPGDESADNGLYAIWGEGNVRADWWNSGFPAVISNCAKCHDAPALDAENWRAVPSARACGSCHDQMDLATGVGHLGGAQDTDANCTVCHAATGSSVGLSVTTAHDFSVKDVRNQPEFDVTLTVSTPGNGQFFVAGESPVVTIQLRDLENSGALVDHNTLISDASAEGCTVAPCPPRDGLLAASNFFVHGPRAQRNPVLTSKARVKLTSTSAGPFDISSAGATLGVRFDGGRDLYLRGNGGRIVPGVVSVPVSSGSFASTAAATGQEVVTWLNNHSAFHSRGIAYLEPNGNVSIRSRNLGELFSLQLVMTGTACAGVSTPVCSVFGGNTTTAVVGGTTASNSMARQANPANNDPKVQWFADHVTYNLDPVDDLEPGTYVVTAEIGDRGRRSATDYKTPSVASTTFQVGTATPELPPAGNCNMCHQAQDGRGMVLDYSRHQKLLGANAVDQCAACHDYQTQTASGEWTGAKSLARRIHAVHYGANLNYPLVTVGYTNGDVVAGRNWYIQLPLDPRNCNAACHQAGTTSQSWQRKPTRGACYGCHDSDAARAHLRIQTYDPSPLDPWSGDEEESCATCHASP